MNILEKIIEYKKTEVEAQKKVCSLQELQKKQSFLAVSSSDDRPFIKKLKEAKQNNKIALIAEVKKASPSKGIIKEDFRPVETAKIYEKAGASAISVLTDEKFFQGKIQYLKDIKNAVNIPVLRKDFIIDEYQIFQTKEMGADIILLIAAALTKSELKNFYNLSKELGLDVLLEVHDKEEFDFAREIKADIIGINNRNLKTFEISLDNTIDLIKNENLDNTFIISESGIASSDDVKLIKSFGANGILVGESLMKSNNVEQDIISLLL